MYICNAKGNVLVKESNFIADFSCSNSTGLYISYDTRIVVAINNSKYVGNSNSCSVVGLDDVCSGVWIEPSNDAVEFSWFLFKNTNFFNYDYGLNLSTSGKNTVIELFDVNIHNNQNSIFIQMNGGTNDSSGTVDMLSATFVSNVLGSLVLYCADAINISSATFINNTVALVLTNAIAISMSSATFMNNNAFAMYVDGADTASISSATFVDNLQVNLLVNTVNIASTTFILSHFWYGCRSAYTSTINLSSTRNF